MLAINLRVYYNKKYFSTVKFYSAIVDGLVEHTQ